jgi:tetratricopeptide (TPR) repeat protein
VRLRPPLLFNSLPGVLAAALLAGCVYYNGMYNANRLAKSARKAEQEGRTFEANNLWGQVATKAESVVVRHPRSKYAGEAAILRGLALARLGQCDQAMAPLSRIAVAQLSSDLSEDAWLATGRCHLMLGNVSAADAAFAQVLDSKNSVRRREARFQRARTLRYSGNYEAALSALEGVEGPKAIPERLLALAGAGRVPEAMALADSLVARGDTTQPWDSLIVTLGRQDPVKASSLVDRLRRLPGRSAEMRARWLVEDGVRMVQSDTARAAARFREAARIGGSGEAAGSASLQLVRLELRTLTQPQDLSPVIRTLRGLAARNEIVATDLTQLSLTAAGVFAAADSIAPAAPQGDLRLFLAAEVARDSLLAPRLAEGMFLRIMSEWPDSPYAPKAILAAQQLNPAWADSARTLLEGRYIDSPYLAITRGEEAAAYQQLEDSLGAFAAAVSAPAGRARRAAPGRPAPPVRDDDEAPGRRRPQPAPTVRVVEP